MPNSRQYPFHPLLQKLRAIINTTAYSIFSRLHPLKRNKVVLVSLRNQVLTDNLLYIHDQLDKEKYDVSAFFFAVRPRSLFGRLSQDLRFLCVMAQAEYTVVDDYFRLVYPLKLRPGARLVQVWHAIGALKRVGYSRGGRAGGPVSTSLSHKNYTDVIVSADSVRQNYAEAFGVPLNIVQALGSPRSDLFFDQTQQDSVRASLRQKISQLENRRVILFAPTFRGGQKRDAHYPPQFLDLERIGAALSDNDLLILKMHPFVKQAPTIPAAYRDRIIDLSWFAEFNHLLLVTDLLITDYSSVIFDYAFLGRPVVFYVPDLDSYDEQRGFYYDFDEYAYGPQARSLDELLTMLGSSEIDQARVEKFREKFLNRCEGHATQRVIQTIFSEVGNHEA